MLLFVILLGLWVVIGFLGLLRPTSLRLVAHVLFPLGALVGIGIAATAVMSITSPTEQWVLAIGLPDLPVHLRRDALSNVFLFLLGAASAGISVFGAGYFRRGEGTLPGLLCLQYHLFLAAMGAVLLADDAYSFMVAWES
jgi:formate hydrogenlyase subunit 3/multisubunit Na+/H+ antiporter MnhD subunit